MYVSFIANKKLTSYGGRVWQYDAVKNGIFQIKFALLHKMTG